jgi:hypothetical protein
MQILPPAHIAAVLSRFGFDPSRFDTLRARLLATTTPEDLHLIRASVAPPPPGCAEPLPAQGTAERLALAAEGAEAIARGELGSVVLAGGMATRFGSVVKALASLELDDGPDWCFLDAKLRDLTLQKGAVPGAIMTSFATHEGIGLVLGGLGAEVVKVEPPGGNATRHIGPFLDDEPGPGRSLHFWAYNRGKQSVVLDLDSAEGKAGLRRLPNQMRQNT